MFAFYGYLLLYIQCARKLKQAHLQSLRAYGNGNNNNGWNIILERCRHKVKLCNFPGGGMIAPWVMLFKYSNDPEYMQSIISDYSARGRGNKLITYLITTESMFTTHTHKQGLEGSFSGVQMLWVGCADSPVNMALK